MITYKSFKFKLLPSHNQIQQLLDFAGQARLVYNTALQQYKLALNLHIKPPHPNQQINELPDLKNSFPFLKESPAQCLQQRIRDLHIALDRFYKKTSAFPKFRKKGIHDTIRFPEPKAFNIRRLNKNTSVVNLPKLKEIKFRWSRKLEGKVKSATITKKVNVWYISFLCEVETENVVVDQLPNYNYVKVKKKGCKGDFYHITKNFDDPNLNFLGIDLGVTDTVMDSNHESHNLPDSIKFWEKRKSWIQQKHSGKVKFSSNWRTAQDKIRKIDVKISNIRKDFHHKLSSQLVKNHDIIVFENLKIQNMTRSASGTVEAPGKNVAQKRGLNRAILRQGWGMFRSMMEYKMFQSGKLCLRVDAKNTSQKCHVCNEKGDRVGKDFNCVGCGLRCDADWNGAMNVMAGGRSVTACLLSGVGKQEPTVGVLPTGIPVL